MNLYKNNHINLQSEPGNGRASISLLLQVTVVHDFEQPKCINLVRT